MKFPVYPPERAERHALIRHARALEMIARKTPSCALSRCVSRAYDAAEGTAGTTIANDLLRARVARYWCD
jgi:hypothetical protein